MTDILGLSPAFAKKAPEWMEMIQPGAWCVPDATYKGLGSMYWVRAEALLVPNPLLVGKSSHLPPIPLVCDNEYHPGFGVYIAKPGETIKTKENPKFVETVHANGFAIEPAAKSTNWIPWVDSKAPYPIGSAITWHGGVHVFADKTVDRKLYSIGPGEIVLARFPDESAPPKFPLSNGFVLIKHRLDVERRTLIAPLGKDEKEESGKEAIYSLVMHTAPISSYLESVDGKPIMARKADAPRWLRRVLPEPIPALRHFIPGSSTKALSVHKDRDAADKVEWTSFPLAPTGEYGKVGVDIDVDESGADPKLNGMPTKKVSVGGTDHVAIPDPAATKAQLAAKSLAHFQPKLAAEAQLQYFNPITGELIAVGKIKAKVGQPVTTKGTELAVVRGPDGQAVVRDGKTLVAVPLHATPGFLATRESKLNIDHDLVSLTKPATLSMQSEGGLQSLGSIDAPTRLLFSGKLTGNRAQVDLLAVVKVPAATYAQWCKDAKTKTGVAPIKEINPSSTRSRRSSSTYRRSRCRRRR